MRGTSLASLDRLQEGFEPVLRDAGAQALALGGQLFSVVDVLDGSGALRRSLSDPSRSGEDKAALVRRLLEGSADAPVVELLAQVVRARWTAESDLVDAVEGLALEAVLASADSRGALEQVEDELFRVTRALAGQREVRAALADVGAPAARRTALIEGLLAGRADEATLVLARRAAAAPRGRSFVVALGWFGEAAARRRDRLVASVIAGAPLSPAQAERLSALLERSYGRKVQLNVTVDPEVIGGLRVQVGADVVDSTVLARLADARRRLAG